MRVFAILSLLLAGQLSLSAQGTGVYAIVTVSINGSNGSDRFVIQLDPGNAPRSVAQLMLLADPSGNFYRNSGFANPTNSPAGNFRASDEAGFFTANSDDYLIAVNGSSARPLSDVSSGSVARVFRAGLTDPIATFNLRGNTWVDLNEPESPYDYSISYNSNFLRHMLEVEVDLPYRNATSGALTSGPFYDSSGTIPITGGSFPFLTLGDETSGPTVSPGWFLADEILNPAVDSIDSNSIFGNHFVTSGGTINDSQRYAVAFANEEFTSPNTSSSRIQITGFAGNPFFEGRHTYIGQIFNGSYQNQSVSPPTIIPGSRFIVDTLLTGSPRVSLTSIRIETIGTPFLPIDGITVLPSLGFTTSEPSLDFTSTDNPKLFTNSTSGQIRLIESSANLRTFTPAGQSSFPIGSPREGGFAFNDDLARQFFRVDPFVVTYPAWPSQQFSLTNLEIRFRGRAIDSDTGPQALNDFTIDFNSTGTGGSLTDTAGNLDGNDFVQSLTYTAMGPYQAELSMNTFRREEPLKLRLYFEEEGNTIGRYHLLIPSANNPLSTEKNEFGLWRIEN